MTDPGFDLNPHLNPQDFQETAVRAFDEVPRVSYFSTTDGPNASGVSAAQGTLGIDIGPSARTVAWIAHRTGSNWSELL